jgi:hypothetical protein
MDTPTPGRQAFTISEFCEQHRFSRAFFYLLKKRGKAPRITSIGARRIITIEDAAAWRKAMAAEAAA